MGSLGNVDTVNLDSTLDKVVAEKSMEGFSLVARKVSSAFSCVFVLQRLLLLLQVAQAFFSSCRPWRCKQRHWCHFSAVGHGRTALTRCAENT